MPARWTRGPPRWHLAIFTLAAAWGDRRKARDAYPEQLEPERARSCRNAITMAAVMIDEIKLRAHAHPIVRDDG